MKVVRTCYNAFDLYSHVVCVGGFGLNITRLRPCFVSTFEGEGHLPYPGGQQCYLPCSYKSRAPFSELENPGLSLTKVHDWLNNMVHCTR